jgi:hypothetical protein
MTLRRVSHALFAALLTSFVLVSVAQSSEAATTTSSTIKGVASLDGKGVAGLQVRLMQSDDDGDFYKQFASAVTSSKGSFTFSKVPLHIDQLSYRVVLTDSTHKVITEQRVVKPKPHTTVTRNITLHRAATLAGTLARQDGTTPHNISVELIGGPSVTSDNYELDRYNHLTHLHVHTNGAYEFEGLPAGTYSLDFSDDSGKYLDQCYDNVLAKIDEDNYPKCFDGGTPGSTQTKLVGGQEATLNAQLMSHVSNTISGTVRDPAGNPLKGISIDPFPNGEGSTNGGLWGTYTQSTGNFRNSRLYPGGWQLEVRDPANIWAPQWYDKKPSQAGSTVLNVGPADVSGITITMLSRSIIKATGTAGHGSATFEVLTTRKAGGNRPGGTVTVNHGSVTRTVTLVGGRATVKLTGVNPGKRTFTVRYSGNSTTAGTSKDVVVLVK